MPIESGLMNVYTAGTLTVHYIRPSVSPTLMDCLCVSLVLDNKATSLTNEVEADKLFPVFEAFRFDSHHGRLSIVSLTGSGQFCISN